MFGDVVERKDAFLDCIENKICIFPKGSMVFVKKSRCFHLSFYCKMDLEKVFGKLLEREEASFDHEKHGLKTNSQNLYYSKGVSPWFFKKSEPYFIFCFNGKWIRKK